jgi:cupin 2 domain-containing protein
MNIYENAVAFDSEKLDVLLKAKNVRIERIISSGQVTPDDFIYDQDENEFVILADGEAELDISGERVALKRGDTINIPAHVKHRVVYTSKEPPCIWLCIFYSD